MTTRSAEVHGAEVGLALVPEVTGVVAGEVTAWQARPLWRMPLVGESAGEGGARE
jgi:hypothetical protein